MRIYPLRFAMEKYLIIIPTKPVRGQNIYPYFHIHLFGGKLCRRLRIKWVKSRRGHPTPGPK